jgi:hypothetical protein
MKPIFILLIVLLSIETVTAQHSFVVATDTSYVAFPQTPNIMVNRVGSGRNVSFQLSRKNFKAFLATAAFLQENYNLSALNLKACRELQANRDSTVALLEKKIVAETNRTNLFKTSYDQLKSVSDTYNIELSRCKNDLDTLNRERKKSQRRSFIKGLLGGFAIGVLGGLTVAVVN